MMFFFFFFSSRRRHTRLQGDWSSDVCSSDLPRGDLVRVEHPGLVAGHENRALVWREGGAEHGGGVHELLDRVLANGSGGPAALRSGCAWDHAGECEQWQGQTSVRGRATHGELGRRTQQSSGVSPASVGYSVPEPV